MNFGLQIPRFQSPGGPPHLAETLANVARAAEDAGFTSLWLMDHFFQIRAIGKPEDGMLEAYTTLGYLAACTSRARLGTLVSGVHHRQPGVLVKQVTTLDVLSGGRAWLGIGAGWYARESHGLGIPFPPLRERFERLEETLKIANQMWRDDTRPFLGKHYQLQEPLNVPAPISQPRPRILIGGGGERKTLRLVARYADACNLFARLPVYDLARKLETLREYCIAEGRPFESIEKTALADWDVTRRSPDRMLDQVRELRELEFDTLIVSLKGIETLKPIEVLARDVLPLAKPL